MAVLITCAFLGNPRCSARTGSTLLFCARLTFVCRNWWKSKSFLRWWKIGSTNTSIIYGRDNMDLVSCPTTRCCLFAALHSSIPAKTKLICPHAHLNLILIFALLWSRSREILFESMRKGLIREGGVSAELLVDLSLGVESNQRPRSRNSCQTQPSGPKFSSKQHGFAVARFLFVSWNEKWLLSCRCYRNSRVRDAHRVPRTVCGTH